MKYLLKERLYFGWFLMIAVLFFYSYTQVDLNLTLSEISIWQSLEKSFQYIGWFQRPISTAIYLFILLALFTLYALFLFFAAGPAGYFSRSDILALWRSRIVAGVRQGSPSVRHPLFGEKEFWRLAGVTAFVLWFSYNAFSYDLFNYIFDARIFTLHGQNPYFHKALDYLGDPWIRFMRWTHRTYPYGPVWLGITIPLSYLGFQIFLPTLFLFKALVVGSYLGVIYFIGKILEVIDPKRKLFGMAFFAFNPLVIIEGLVSAHNDLVMMVLAMAALYFLLKKRYFWAFGLLFLSVGVKFATALLLPLFVFGVWGNWRKKMFWVGLLGMTMAVVLASLRTELQPWYLLFVLPLAALLTRNRLVVILSFTVSAGLLLHYTPFLYWGHWDEPVPAIKHWLLAGSVLLGVLGYLGAIGSARVKRYLSRV